MSRILCMDYGLRRVGYALSDPGRILATALKTYERPKKSDLNDVIRHTEELMANHDVAMLLLGLPLRTDAKESSMTAEIEKLKEHFESTGVKTELYDERFSTVIAERIMTETGISKHKKKGIVDGLAAEIILQDYLELLRNREANERRRDGDGNLT